MRLFAYGSLMLPDMMKQIVGAARQLEPAVLHGYQRYSLKRSIYPALLRDESKKRKKSKVFGCLYHSLTRRDMKMLLAYEGRLYYPATVQVVTAAGRELNAFVFVTHPACKYQIGVDSWSLEQLKRPGKNASK